MTSINNKCSATECYKFDCNNAAMKNLDNLQKIFENNKGVITQGASASDWAVEIATCPLISCEASFQCNNCFSFQNNILSIKTDV